METADHLTFVVAMACWVILYALPGVLLSEILFQRKLAFRARIVVGIAIVCCFYVFLGYILSRFNVLTIDVAFYTVLILDLLLLVAFTMFKFRNGWDFRDALAGIPRKKKHIAAVLLVIMVVTVLIFFSWENKAPGIASVDRSDHLVRVLDLAENHKIPEHELLTQVNTYYPRGEHMAIFFFISPTYRFMPKVFMSSPLLLFQSLIIALLVLIIYALAVAITDSEDAALYAAVFSLALAFMFIFSSFTCTFGIMLAGVALLLEIEFMKGRAGRGLLALSAVLGSAVFIVHLVSFVIYILFSLGLLLGALISGDSIGFKRKSSWDVLVALLGSVIVSVGFLALTAPSLLKGTSIYIGLNRAGSTTRTSDLSLVKYVKRLFKFRFHELRFFLSSAFVLIPFAAVALLERMKKRRWMLAFMLFTAIGLSVSYLLWLSNRVHFVLLFPICILAGWGLAWFFRVSRGQPVITSSKALIVALVLIATVGLSSLNAIEGTSVASKGIWNKPWKVKSYASETTFQLVNWMNENNIEGMRFAADSPISGYMLVDSLTGNKVLAAAGFKGVKSFVDFRKFFDEQTSREDRQRIMSEYEIDGFITVNKKILKELRKDELGFLVFNPCGRFYVLLPEQFSGVTRRHPSD